MAREPKKQSTNLAHIARVDVTVVHLSYGQPFGSRAFLSKGSTVLTELPRTQSEDDIKTTAYPPPSGNVTEEYFRIKKLRLAHEHDRAHRLNDLMDTMKKAA